MNPNLDDIFSSLRDFDLADCISCVVEEKYGYEVLMQWPDSVPEVHRVVHFIWSNTGYAECEGYVMFMILDCHHAALPVAFRLVGLLDLANIVDLCLNQSWSLRLWVVRTHLKLTSEVGIHLPSG